MLSQVLNIATCLFTDACVKMRNACFVQSNYFGGLAVAPVISSARCTESVDERGGRAVDVAIHCTVKGVDRVSELHSVLS